MIVPTIKNAIKPIKEYIIKLHSFVIREYSKLEKIFNPGDSYDPGKYNACCYDEKMKRYLTVNEIALRKLNECNIKEVYSVFSTKDFFGIPREDFCTINPESGCEEGCENWGWFTYIRFESDLVYFLVNNGIKVEDYDTN